MPIQGISGSAGVSPTYDTTPAVGGNATGAADGAALPSPSTQLVPVADLGAQLAALLIKSGQNERDIDDKMRAADEKQEDDAESAQVASMRQKASDIESEGLVEGLTTIGAGAMQLGSAVDSAQSSMQPAGSPASADLKTQAAAWSFEGTLLKGEGDIAGTSFKGAQATDDANATADGATASHAKRAADDASDDMKSARDFINSAVDFYKQYTETKAQEQAALVHGA